ncbi:hypothetical protein GCM10009648_11770 [Tsukamurella spumae]
MIAAARKATSAVIHAHVVNDAIEGSAYSASAVKDAEVPALRVQVTRSSASCWPFVAVTGPGNCSWTTITAEFGASDDRSAVPERTTVPPVRCTRILMEAAEVSKACETTSPSWLN